MFVAKILVGLIALLIPIGLYILASSRGDARPASPRAVVLTFLFGLGSFLPVVLVERALTRASGPTEEALKKPFALDVAAFIFAFLVAAPLEEGLKVAAAAPVWRLRVARHRPFDGISYAAAAALGFATSQNALFLFERPLSWLNPVRAVLSAVAAMAFASLWGYALGKGAPHYRLGGGLFNGAWLLATLGNAVAHHVAFVLGPNAMLAMIPILVTSGGLSWYGARELLKAGKAKPHVEPRNAEKPPLTIPKPTLRALRAALRHAERPISLFWIVTGAIVTTGVIVVMLAGAVLVGRQLGVDFGAVDRDASQAEAIPPLLLLSGAVLLAFPLAGWVVARASAAKSVIEPAISSLFAIIGAIVLLGLAAPVAVVIALACAPFAFGLAYFGAWLGLSSSE